MPDGARAIWVLSNQNGIGEASVSLLLQPYLTYGFRIQGQNEIWDVFCISGREVNKGLSSQRVLCNLRAAKSWGTQVLVWDSSFWQKSIMHHGLPEIIKLCMGSIQALQLLHERQCYCCYLYCLDKKYRETYHIAWGFWHNFKTRDIFQ